ncbi:MAG: hypothetical protein K2W82_19325 [Candidatus Obscuribacterales bacterium]|nr:hypothetical protein [Candidatus Obscuribacterales bacterium]
MDNNTTLFDHWTLKGHWWQAESTSYDESQVKRYAGELSFDGNGKGAILQLFGAPEEVVSDWTNSQSQFKPATQSDSSQVLDKTPPTAPIVQETVSDRTTPNQPWLHGRSICGKKITLIDTVFSGSTRNYSSPIATQSSRTVSVVIVNEHVLPKTMYSQITMSFPGLEGFFMIKDSIGWSSNNNLMTFSVQTSPKSMTIESGYSGNPITIEFWQKAIIQGSHNKLDITPRSAITIRSNNPESLDWWVELIYSFQYFLSVLYGFPTCPNHLFFDLAQDKQCSVWYAFDRAKLKSEVIINDMIVTTAVFDQTLIANALKKWLELPNRTQKVVHQFVGNFFFPHQKSPVDLVFFSQTLEVFHSHLKKETNSLNESQNRLLRGVKGFLQRNIKSQDKQLYIELCNRLARTGYPSQSNRLCELFSILNEYIPGIYYDDPKDFVTCLVDTRNFYIHGNLPYRNTFLDGFEQVAAVEGLKLAILLLFLRLLEFPADTIKRRLHTNREYRIWSYLSSEDLTTEILRNKVKNKRINSHL